MARTYATLESAARNCCFEILERSGIEWHNLPPSEQAIFAGMVQNAHAWVQDVTFRQADRTGLDPAELLGVVVDQLREEHGWDVGILYPWLLYAGGACRTCGLAMPLSTLGSHLRRCLDEGDAQPDEWKRRLN